MLSNGFIHHSLGVMASSANSPSRLRYCPVCVQQDVQTVGEPFWRRVHQVVGVTVCPEHNVFLEDSTVATNNRRNRHVYLAAQDVLAPGISRKLNLKQLLYQTLITVATDAGWLLQQTVRTTDLSALQNAYRWLLAEKGYATYAGRVRVSDLVEQFREFYGEPCLERLQCALPTNQQETWLHRLVRRPRSSHHPLRHLLFIRFLDQTPATFFSGPINSPFGHGPWPCLNHVSKHYQQTTIKDSMLRFTKDRGRPIGTFHCPECGFTYQRTGPDRTPEDRFRIDRMVDFGEFWKRKSQELKDSDISLREKARILGVTTRTVKRYEEPAHVQSAPPNISLQARVTSRREQELELTQFGGSPALTVLRRRARCFPDCSLATQGASNPIVCSICFRSRIQPRFTRESHQTGATPSCTHQRASWSSQVPPCAKAYASGRYTNATLEIQNSSKECIVSYNHSARAHPGKRPQPADGAARRA